MIILFAFVKFFLLRVWCFLHTATMILHPRCSPCNIILSFFTSKREDYIPLTSCLYILLYSVTCFCQQNVAEVKFCGLNSKNFTAYVLLLEKNVSHVMNQGVVSHMKAKTTRRKLRYPVNSYQCSLGMSIEPVLDVSIRLPHYLSTHMNALILKYYLYYFILIYFALISSFVR